MGLIAMVANTLFERTGDLQQKVAESENMLLGIETAKQSLQNQLQEATCKYDEKLRQCEKLELIKADVDKQMSSITTRHKRTEKKLEIYEQKCAKLEDDLQKREREVGDLEF